MRGPAPKVARPGARAEEAVVAHLKAAGVELIATNLRLGHLEIDIVGREGRVIVVVEVRERGAGAWTTGFGSIDAKKRLRIRRAAERLWQRRYRNDASVDRLRIDAASVTFDAANKATVSYVKAAF